jgi:hypothetical protein
MFLADSCTAFALPLFLTLFATACVSIIPTCKLNKYLVGALTSAVIAALLTWHYVYKREIPWKREGIEGILVYAALAMLISFLPVTHILRTQQKVKSLKSQKKASIRGMCIGFSHSWYIGVMLWILLPLPAAEWEPFSVSMSQRGAGSQVCILSISIGIISAAAISGSLAAICATKDMSDG